MKSVIFHPPSLVYSKRVNFCNRADITAWGVDTVDWATFGMLSYMGERYDDVIDYYTGGIGQTVRERGGSQRDIQNTEDYTYGTLSMVGPGTVLKKVRQLSNARKMTRASQIASSSNVASSSNGVVSVMQGLDLAIERPLKSKYYTTVFQSKLKKGEHFPHKSDRIHFQEANKQLHQAMIEDPNFKHSLDSLYPGLESSIQPKSSGVYPSTPPTQQGLTWHHNSHESGVMELMPRSHHRAPGEVQKNLHPNQEGGMKIWGGGREPNNKGGN